MNKNGRPKKTESGAMKLCESEFNLMCALWETEPIGSGKFSEHCQNIFGWKKTTTYTLLKRLSDKGFIKIENTILTSLVSRDTYLDFDSKDYVNLTFKGSLPGFLVSFFGGRKISEEQAEALKKLIDEYKA